MIPLTVNPKVVVLLNPEGLIEAFATNVAPDLIVDAVNSPEDYRELALGMTFDTTRPETLPPSFKVCRTVLNIS